MRLDDESAEASTGVVPLGYATPRRAPSRYKRLAIATIVILTTTAWMCAGVGVIVAWLAIPALCRRVFGRRAWIWALVLNQIAWLIPLGVIIGWEASAWTKVVSSRESLARVVMLVMAVVAAVPPLLDAMLLITNPQAEDIEDQER